MGHQGGYEASGARGLVPVTSSTVVEAFDPANGEVLDLAALARPHADMAMQTLVKVCKARKTSGTAKVAAAGKILENAGGRPAVQNPRDVDNRIQVVIERLFTSGPTDVIDVRGYGPVVEVVEEAEAEVVEVVVEMSSVAELAPMPDSLEMM